VIELGRVYDRMTPRPWPGMSAQDTIIWMRGLHVVTQPGDALYYNVRIGSQNVIADNVPPAIAAGWQRLNAKRVDVVLERDGRWIIIEVRHIGTSAAMGRLIQYRDLWRIDRPDDELELLLVTDWLDPDIPGMLTQLGIAYLVI